MRRPAPDAVPAPHGAVPREDAAHEDAAHEDAAHEDAAHGAVPGEDAPPPDPRAPLPTPVPAPSLQSRDAPFGRRSGPLREHDAPVRGAARYAADHVPTGALRLAFARAPRPGGRPRLDVAHARAMPGVVAVLTGADARAAVPLTVNPVIEGIDPPPFELLARDRAAFAGQPVAAVLADTAARARDAADAIDVGVEDPDGVEDPVGVEGPVAATAEAAREDGPRDPSDGPAPDRARSRDAADRDAADDGPALGPVIASVGWSMDRTDRTDPGATDEALPPAEEASPAADEALGATEIEVTVAIRHPRLCAMPLEPRAITVEHDGDGTLDIRCATQTPHRARAELARMAGLDPARLRVRADRVGGAFGAKASVTPEEVVAVLAAARLGRSVAWVADRTEDFAAAPHGRGTRMRGSLRVDGQGRFTALRVAVEAETGAWATTSAAIPAWNAAGIPPGPYAVPRVTARARARASATAPIGIYRGAGRPEAAMVVERLIDEAAARLGLDPIALRLRNLVPEGGFPRALPSGRSLDSGAFAEAVARLRAMADEPARRAALAARRAGGAIAGLGCALYVEPSGSGWESAAVRVLPDGSAEARVGATAQGQARESAFARIVAGALGVDEARVRIVHGDTGATPEGIGALASRSTAIGGSALLRAAREAARHVRELRARGEGVPLEGVTVALRHEAEGEAWGFGAHLAQVAIDPETGALAIEGYWAVDDAGALVLPEAARDQIVGGLAQGFGEAVMERIVHDAEGHLLTGSLTDYAVPRASDCAFLGRLALAHMETPSPRNPLGAKGCGEAGAIGAPAAIANAVHDAFRARGAVPPDMPYTPDRLWTALRAGTTGRTRTGRTRTDGEAGR